MSNHLGNVLVTLSDRKILTTPPTSNTNTGTDNGGCATGSAKDVLNIYVRNSASLYTARTEINFLPSNFESGNNDAFNAEINPALATCVTESVTYIAGSSSIPQGSYFAADIVSATDYYPFGLTMTGRSFSSDKYRYGFNGKEKDKDINSLTAYDYGFRIYNPSIGKFLSVDPLSPKYPELSSYQFAENSPILYEDLDGLESTTARGVTVPYRSNGATPVLSNSTVGRGGSITPPSTSRGSGSAAAPVYTPTGTPYLATYTKDNQTYGVEEPNVPPHSSAARRVQNDGWIITTQAGTSYTQYDKRFATQSEWEEYRRITGFGKGLSPNPDALKALDKALEEWSNGRYKPTVTTTTTTTQTEKASQHVEEKKEEKNEFIYRGGNPNDGNLTPRPEKDTKGDKRGLSTFTTSTEAKTKSGKKVATKISVKSLRAAVQRGSVTVHYVSGYSDFVVNQQLIKVPFFKLGNPVL